jgi:hypothetical protein
MNKEQQEQEVHAQNETFIVAYPWVGREPYRVPLVGREIREGRARDHQHPLDARESSSESTWLGVDIDHGVH